MCRRILEQRFQSTDSLAPHSTCSESLMAGTIFLTSSGSQWWWRETGRHGEGGLRGLWLAWQALKIIGTWLHISLPVFSSFTGMCDSGVPRIQRNTRQERAWTHCCPRWQAQEGCRTARVLEKALIWKSWSTWDPETSDLWVQPGHLVTVQFFRSSCHGSRWIIQVFKERSRPWHGQLL